MRYIAAFLFVLVASQIKSQDHTSDTTYAFTICSGDTARIGVPPELGFLRIWPETAPFLSLYGDTVSVYSVNNSDSALDLQHLLTSVYIDTLDPNLIFVYTDTIRIRVLPALQANLPEMSYSICADDTIPIYYPYVPFGYMRVDPAESSFLDTLNGAPRLDIFPGGSTVYDLYIENIAGCSIGPFPLSVTVNSQLDSISFALYDSICYSSDPFVLDFYPPDALVFGPGVGSDGLFYPELAGTGLHTLTLVRGSGICEVVINRSIYIVSDEEVQFPDIPNVCQNAPKIELSGGTPAGGVYLGEGVQENFLNPQQLSPGSYEVSYSFLGADECRIQKTQSYFIKAIPPQTQIVFSGDSTTCAGDTLVLGASLFAPRYIWSTGDSTQYITAFNQGYYYVSILASNGCTNFSDTTFFGFFPPPVLTLSSPTWPNGYNVSAPGAGDGSINLSINGGAPPYEIVWSNGATEEDLAGLNSGPYTVTLTDSGGCIARDSIFLSDPVNTSIGAHIASGEFKGLKIPNGFTPNGDGFNDTWRISGLTPALDNNEIFVFDVRGNLVYRMQNYRAQWDGRDNNGTMLPKGEYLWMFRANAIPATLRGTVNLSR
jgi:gliding motility-associated-like protein